MSLIFALLLATSASPTGIPATSQEVRAIVKEMEKANSPELMSQLVELAKHDDSAHILLGEIYFFGLFNTPVNEDLACDYFEPLASKYGEAAHNFATCHFRANGSRKDQALARQYYAKAIELGWRDSSCALGNMMIDGQGGAKDVAAGLQLCLTAAEKGVSHAQADYGTYLLLGKIIPKDAVAARLWLERAAMQDHANAAYLLGQIYWNGDGIEKDRSIAAKWWKVAFENGRPDAARRLADEAITRMMVTEGGQTKIFPDIVSEAIGWLEIAKKQNGSPQEKAKAGETLDLLYQLRDKAAQQQ